jgi:hypothetical protein
VLNCFGCSELKLVRVSAELQDDMLLCCLVCAGCRYCCTALQILWAADRLKLMIEYTLFESII